MTPRYTDPNANKPTLNPRLRHNEKAVPSREVQADFCEQNDDDDLTREQLRGTVRAPKTIPPTAEENRRIQPQ